MDQQVVCACDRVNEDRAKLGVGRADLCEAVHKARVSAVTIRQYVKALRGDAQALILMKITNQ